MKTSKLPTEYPIYVWCHVKHPNEEGLHGPGHNEHRVVVLDGLTAPATPKGLRQYPDKKWQHEVLEKAFGTNALQKAFAGIGKSGDKKQSGVFQRLAVSWKSFQDKSQNEKQVPVKGKVQLCSYALSFSPKPPNAIQQLKDGWEAFEGMHPKHMRRKPEPIKKSLSEGYRSLEGTYVAMKTEIPPLMGDMEIVKQINEALIDENTIKPGHKIHGWTDDVTACEHCGKSNISGTFGVEHPDGSIIHYGFSCVNKVFGSKSGSLMVKRAKDIAHLQKSTWEQAIGNYSRGHYHFAHLVKDGKPFYPTMTRKNYRGEDEHFNDIKRYHEADSINDRETGLELKKRGQ